MSRLVTRTATDWAYAAGWMAVRAVPESFARTAFDAGARYAARHGGFQSPRAFATNRGYAVC